MNYGSKLPFTGAGVVVGGMVINQTWVLIGGLAFLAIGVMFVRLGWRRDKSAGTP